MRHLGSLLTKVLETGDTMTVLNDTSDLYYDPFDIEIDKDPYPIWRRMRDEAPL